LDPVVRPNARLGLSQTPKVGWSVSSEESFKCAKKESKLNENLILITGCSGGGKSTLLDALGDKGFAIVPEPGRRIIAEELAQQGTALPWENMKTFAQRAVATAKADLETARKHCSIVFFDRGLIDAAVALENSGGQRISDTLGVCRHYGQRVFLAPPWKAIFSTDRERRHDFNTAVEEYLRIECTLDVLGYEITELPKVSVQERVGFVLDRCGWAL